MPSGYNAVRLQPKSIHEDEPTVDNYGSIVDDQRLLLSKYDNFMKPIYLMLIK